MRYWKPCAIGILILILGYIVTLCCLPPISKDALTHHLAVPKLYLKHGGVYEIPFMLFSYYPMNIDILYFISLYFGNDILPKYIHFVFALLTVIWIYVYIKRKVGDRYAIIGAILFLYTPIIVKLSTTVYVDLGLIFFSTGSLLFFLQWVEKDFSIKYLLLSAIFCGLAMGTKYNGLVTACLLVLFIPFSFSRLAGPGRLAGILKPLGYTLLFLLISMAVFSPWMVRNYVWKKNPIYPLCDRWFQSAAGQEKEDRVGIRANTGGSVGLFTKRRIVYGETGWEMALLPIRVFFQGEDGDPQYFDGRLNPFLLILPLFAFAGSKRDPPLVRYEKWALLAFAVLYFAIVLFTREMRIRYIAPIIPPLVILSAFGVRNLARKISELRFHRMRTMGWGLLSGGLLFFMGWNVPYLVSYFKALDPVPYLTDEIRREEYLVRHVAEYPALQYINGKLPLQSRTFFLFLGNRGYYCDRPYILDRGVGFYQIIKNSTRPEQVVSRLRENGISHLLIRYDIFDKWRRDRCLFSNSESSMLNQFIKNHTNLLFFKRNYGVFLLSKSRQP